MSARRWVVNLQLFVLILLHRTGLVCYRSHTGCLSSTRGNCDGSSPPARRARGRSPLIGVCRMLAYLARLIVARLIVAVLTRPVYTARSLNTVAEVFALAYAGVEALMLSGQRALTASAP